MTPAQQMRLAELQREGFKLIGQREDALRFTRYALRR